MKSRICAAAILAGTTAFSFGQAEISVTTASTAKGLEATVTVGDFTRTRVLHDSDRDGWCDLWCAIFQNDIEHRNKATDTDGDGLTDFAEMVLWRDPMVKGPLPSNPTPEEIAAGKNAAEIAAEHRAKAMAERREFLAPLIIQPIAKKDGTPTSTAEKAGERKTALAAYAQRLSADAVEGRQRAEALALRLGIDTKFTLPDGRVGALTEALEGIPDYNVAHNVTAADTISTDEVHAGGGSGLSLTGDGQNVGIWDGGDVLSTHVEFTSGGNRVTDMDGTSVLGVQHHPTHVAGTIMARGVDALATGMSPSANLSAYDFNNDFAEMATAAATTTVRISNHSYGLQRGWGFLSIGNVNYLAWWGDTRISNTEDYRFGFYDAFAQTADTIGYAAPDYLSVWAAGNERGGSGRPGADPAGGYYAWDGSAWLVSYLARPNDFANDAGFDLLEGRGVAKNVLTVSAVEDIAGGYVNPTDVLISGFSSVGPPDDGRIKPDIAANGVEVYSATSNGSYANDSGTSMATPSVTGSLALLREHHEALFGTAPLNAATLKGLVIHTADEAGQAAGPDYTFGWGLMNTQQAANLLTAHEQSGAALRHIKQTLLSDGDFVEFRVRALGSEPLRVTAVWTDPAGTVPAAALDVNTEATKALVNDLDLRLTTGATTHFPWRLDPANPANAATRVGDNNRDNVEQVLVDSPIAGEEYLIEVTHKDTLEDDTGATAPQALSLIISGVAADPAPALRVLDVSPTGTDLHTITWASVVGATYRVETSPDLTTGSWSEIPGDYIATKELTAAEVSNNVGEIHRFWRVKRLP